MRAKRWFSDPRFLLCLVAALGSLVAQSGELGSADTMHRLQAAHSFWTSEPPVFPNEYPEFGLHGRGGKLYDWYGIGQPLLLLPFDIVGTYIERLPIFSNYDGTDPTVRDIFVSCCVNSLLSILTALLALRFLQDLKFNEGESIAGALALLFCTTRLHYTQNMMENNYIMLLTLAGFAFQLEWLLRGSTRLLFAGACAFGLNLLTRLTTGMDLIAGGIFLLLILRLEGATVREVWERFLSYSKVAGPVYAVFILIDRWYQYHRFGSFFTTYVSVFAQEYHRLDPSLPANYPWETPFHVGFLGPFITPEKSIFLFDPLIVLTMLVATLAWKYFPSEIRAYVLASFLLVLAYICFYARYTVWSGDFAWGDRYVSTSVELAAFISVPLLMRYRQQLGKVIWVVGVAVVAISAVIQVASLMFWLPLEIYQMETLGHPTFVIGLRFRNIIAFALGKMTQWGLTNHAMTEDPWDYVHITTWNFLPFLLRRVGEAPGWVVKVVFVIWTACLAAFTAAIWRLQHILSSSADADGHPASAA
ncbi:MAG TPA: hypothetical protein VFI95_06905 [Terriglobales bacterium]|nr:hypothetical protein [Terriglobales bacterium]